MHYHIGTFAFVLHKFGIARHLEQTGNNDTLRGMNLPLPPALDASRLGRSAPPLEVLPPVSLATGRVHEACGPARRVLAALAAGRTTGPVFWIAPSWLRGGPNPCGLRRFVDPGRLIFLSPRRPEDLLWTMEEALRPGLVPLVIADLPSPPGLTAIRRLHLAAEEAAPVGLLLLPGEGGARGVESRWWMAPRHHGQTGEAWRLERRRARQAPPAAWTVTPDPHGVRVTPAHPAPA